jgi:hypothetical protein
VSVIVATGRSILCVYHTFFFTLCLNKEKAASTRSEETNEDGPETTRIAKSESCLHHAAHVWHAAWHSATAAAILVLYLGDDRLGG